MIVVQYRELNMAFLCVNTPHIDVFVKKEYLYDLQKGHGELVEGVWVTAKSIQGRALYFETYIPEYGAPYMINYLLVRLYGKRL